MSPATFIAPAAGNIGHGLFAGESIAAGGEILQFTGPRLTLTQVRAKGPLAANALQVGIDSYLDLDPPGRLVNHSCDPNAAVFDNVRLIALRAIAPGQEIRFDYSTTISDGWTRLGNASGTWTHAAGSSAIWIGWKPSGALYGGPAATWPCRPACARNRCSPWCCPWA